MTNYDIAQRFKLLGELMELYGENAFKYRSYANAYTIIKKIQTPLAEMSQEEIVAMDGLGKAISSKIMELINAGKMQLLEKYIDQTPEGIIEMLEIRGLGPKKIRSIWNELGIETIGELLQATEDNQLVQLKGFGQKTQADIKAKVAYYISNKGLHLYGRIEDDLNSFSRWMDEVAEGKWKLVGKIARQEPIVSGIEIILEKDFEEKFNKLVEESDHASFKSEKLMWENAPVEITLSDIPKADAFYQAYDPHFLNQKKEWKVKEGSFQEICALNNIDFVPPEQSEYYDSPHKVELNQLITDEDLRGVIHCHSTYSDGIHSLEEMANYAFKQNYEYLLITDHSKSAFYANGLEIDRVWQQFQEIEKLNQAYGEAGETFTIFRGIESDILSNGSLDYEEDLLREFDCIIASIHSNLRMDKKKATQRLINAIENPYTRILGHPTGRLLLSREGYPIDHSMVIDACAANDVVIEINSSPQRLDIDYRYIGECLDKSVKLSINSDAHSQEAIQYMHYGVTVGRKAWLQPQDNLSSYSLEDFIDFIENK